MPIKSQVKLVALRLSVSVYSPFLQQMHTHAHTDSVFQNVCCLVMHVCPLAEISVKGLEFLELSGSGQKRGKDLN